MLGGLARWLRAAGYDAWWRADMRDWDLIRLARRERRILLTSDRGILSIGIVRDGDVPSLCIPHGLTRLEQLRYVLRTLRLPLGAPRCMTCGGELQQMPKDSVRELIPPRSFQWCQRFYQCRRCGKLFWEGTHWQRIERALSAASDRPERTDRQASNP